MERILQYKYQKLHGSLLETIANFRSGNDCSGLDAFLNIIEDMDDIIQTCICFDDLECIEVFLPVAHALNDAVCNEDVTGVTDILEYSFLPYVEKAIKGVVKT